MLVNQLSEDSYCKLFLLIVFICLSLLTVKHRSNVFLWVQCWGTVKQSSRVYIFDSFQLRFLTGQVDKRTLEKYEREAKEKNRETW